MVRGLAIDSVLLLAAGTAVAAATAELPAVQLRIELRCAPTQASTGGTRPVSTSAPSAPGAVVVGTQRQIDPAPTVTLRTAPRSTAEAGVQLIVANGERARIRWQDERLQSRYELVAAVRGPNAASRPPRLEAGILETTELERVPTELDVQPRWPGGSGPVQMTIGARHGTLAMQTVTGIAPQRWTTLARAVDATPPADGSSALPACHELQLRVTPLP